jgi:hypothetical protein
VPAVSESQRRLLFARFGSKWAHEHGFANKGKLPKHVTKGRTRHPLTRSLIEKGQM